jgi:membrane-associated protein
MTYARFMTYNVVGGALWVVSCTVAGYLFGNLPVVRDNFGIVILGIIAVSLIPAVVEVWRERRRRAGRGRAGAAPPERVPEARDPAQP